MQKNYNIALIVGSGAFGASIASILSHRFKKIILKVRDTRDSSSTNQLKRKSLNLNNSSLAQNIYTIQNWDELKTEDEESLDLMVSGLPSSAIKPFFLRTRIFLKNILKGISLSSLYPKELILSPCN